MEVVVREEEDYLVWCDDCICELGGVFSWLNLLFYVVSYVLGVGVGLVGDCWSLGFVFEIEY